MEKENGSNTLAMVFRFFAELPRRCEVREQGLSPYRAPVLGRVRRSHEREGAEGPAGGLADPEPVPRGIGGVSLPAGTGR